MNKILINSESKSKFRSISSLLSLYTFKCRSMLNLIIIPIHNLKRLVSSPVAMAVEI